MRHVAWVTHHIPKVEERNSALLPGKYAGGAERNNDYMVAAAPDDVEVHWIDAPDWETAMDYERIVVTGTDKLTDEAMAALGSRAPLVWIQHAQTPSTARRDLFRAADRFVTMSRLHRAHEAKWVGRADCFIHSPVPSNCVRPVEKQGFALFAARNHPAKGKINARMWAQRANVPLVELENQPHEVVLEHMAQATWFVHLPKEFDACPLTVIEATLACCQIITDQNVVGRLEPGDPVEILDQQPARFWAMV